MANKKKGFTLVELLVVGGLISLVIGITATLVLSSFNGFARGTRMDHGKQLGLAVYDYYEGRLRATDSLQVGGTAPAGHRALAAAAGRLYLDSQPLYPEDMYGGTGVGITTRVDGYLLHLKVEVYDADGTIFVKDSALRLITLAANGGLVAGSHGETSDPTLYYTD